MAGCQEKCDFVPYLYAIDFGEVYYIFAFLRHSLVENWKGFNFDVILESYQIVSPKKTTTGGSSGRREKELHSGIRLECLFFRDGLWPWGQKGNCRTPEGIFSGFLFLFHACLRVGKGVPG